MPTFTPVRPAFRTRLRAAAVELVSSYAEEADPPVSLQVYPARPASLFPPTAFVDRIREKIAYNGPSRRQRSPIVELVVVHALFDSKATAEDGDAFVDGFLEYVATRYHAAHPNSLVSIPEYEDVPTFTADWLPVDRPRRFYATVFALEGLIFD